MTGTVSGLIFVTIAGVANAAFALPMKYARQWAWENIWLAWTLFALLLLPAVAAFMTVPSLGAVYGDAGPGVVAVVMLCGAGWGLAQVLFGLSIDAIGIGLTFSIVLGVSAAIGSLIPLLRLQSASQEFSGASPILWGVVLVLAGVYVLGLWPGVRASVANLTSQGGFAPNGLLPVLTGDGRIPGGADVILFTLTLMTLRFRLTRKQNNLLPPSQTRARHGLMVLFHRR